MEYLVVPARLVVRVEEKVTVPLDHAGHQGRAGKVDRLRIDRDRQIRSDRDDPVLGDEHLPAGMDLAVDAVEYAHGLQQQRNGFGCRHCGREPEPGLLLP